MKNILYTTPILEYPAAGGPQLRIENSIKALSTLCDLHILHRAAFPSSSVNMTESYFRQFSYNYLTVYKYPRSRSLRFCFRIIKKFFRQEFDPTTAAVIKFIKENKIEIVWFGYGNISYSLIKTVKEEFPDIQVICDTDSVWSRFVLRELPYSQGARKERIARTGALKESEERDWVNLCEVTTAVSEVDAEYYRSIATKPARIKVFSNTIDVQNYYAVPAQPPDFKKPCIYLAGSFGPNSAMNMATNWLLDEILPLVRLRYPHVHLYIVGRNSDKEFARRANEHITVTGLVPSVLPYLCHADVAVVPLQFESGTRFKILEAGACRVPLVSTTLGAEGIPIAHDQDILIADHSADFAGAIVRILDKPELGRRLGESCHRLIVEEYSLNASVREAKAILEYLNND